MTPHEPPAPGALGERQRRSILVVGDESFLPDLIVGALRAYGFAHAQGDDVAPSASLLRGTEPDGEVIEVLVATVRPSTRAAAVPGPHDVRDRTPARGALTPRQVEVLRLVALGKGNAEIAEIRGTTVSAVERTIAMAFAALGIDGDADASDAATG